MKMKSRAVIVVLLLIISGFITGKSGAEVILVPQVQQPWGSTWCWAASIESLTRFYNGIPGSNVAVAQQCNLVYTFRIDNALGYENCCSNPIPGACIGGAGPYLYPPAPAAPFYDTTSEVLNSRNITTGTGGYGQYDIAGIQQQIGSGRPFFMNWLTIYRINPTTGQRESAGHNVIGVGITGPSGNRSVICMNPATNALQTMPYNDVVGAFADPLPDNQHYWIQTLPISRSVPAPHIMINGVKGSYTSNTENVPITVSLNANGYTVPADWWFVIHDTSYNLFTYFDGNLSPTSTPTPVLRNFAIQDIANLGLTATLTRGRNYTIYFGVDFTPNGSLDGSIIYDSIDVVVQ